MAGQLIGERKDRIHMKEALLESLEAAIRQEGIDGWLFCSFRGSDPISENILGLDDAAISTRRWFTSSPLAVFRRGSCTLSSPMCWTHCRGTNASTCRGSSSTITEAGDPRRQECGDAVFTDEFDSLRLSGRRRNG